MSKAKVSKALKKYGTLHIVNGKTYVPIEPICYDEEDKMFLCKAISIDYKNKMIFDLSFFEPKDKIDWERDGVVYSKKEDADYVINDIDWSGGYYE